MVVKAWFVTIVTVVIVAAGGTGLWLTWDSTRTSSSGSLAAPVELSSGNTSTAMTADTSPDPVECSTGDDPVEGDPATDWATIVVDPGRKLDADFVPPDLVPASDAGFDNGEDLVRALTIPDLTALGQAAEANGTPLVVASAYRSYEYQQLLFDNSVDAEGRETALASTARPGHSEHQLGTTIDLINPEASELTDEFANTPVGGWLREHAHEYGFVLSYPDTSTRDRTCYDFEPWHLRYVGRDIAQQIHESGLTPREWMLESGANR
jgi:D-alanyl-D-alanine carboxypeptidase